LNFVEAIAKKRDGASLSREEIGRFVSGAVDGAVSGEQLAAMLMALCIRGANDEETRVLTEAMRDSGAHWSLADEVPGVIDKHSTGGVGDTVSLVFAPLVAATGLPVAMMAGAGLGHTQGTLDKLAAIPGFLPASDRVAALERLGACGVCFATQSEEIAPADRRLYALRDVTATVPSLPLIVASIMSKKLAVGPARLVLDVKAGSGAFCKTDEEATRLAEALVRVGREAGLSVRALVTDMDEPLGDRLGTASEVRAALDVLDGRGDSRLREVVLALATEALRLAGKDGAAARRELEDALASGRARDRWNEVVRAHGGDPDPNRLARARRRLTVTAATPGFVTAIDGETLGWIAVSLGAGRRRLGDTVDFAAGLTVQARIGDRVDGATPLATLEVGARRVDAEAVTARTAAAFTIGSHAPGSRPLIRAALGEGA
jgi:pyrimidine-nucleoside phosphorylase